MTTMTSTTTAPRTITITFTNGDTISRTFARTEVDEQGILRVWPHRDGAAHHCFPVANVRSWSYS